MVFQKGDLVGWRGEPSLIGIVLGVDDLQMTTVQWLDEDDPNGFPNRTFHGRRDETLVLMVAADNRKESR